MLANQTLISFANSDYIKCPNIKHKLNTYTELKCFLTLTPNDIAFSSTLQKLSIKLKAGNIIMSYLTNKAFVIDKFISCPDKTFIVKKNKIYISDCITKSFAKKIKYKVLYK